MDEILEITRGSNPDVGSSNSESNSNKRSLLQRFNHGLLGILYLMAKEVHTTQATLAFLVIVENLQLLYFPFSKSAHFPWHESLHPLIQILNYLNFGFFVHDSLDTSTVLAIFVVVTLLVTANILLACYVGVSFARGNVKMIWMLSILRQLAHLTTTVLFMPLITVLLLAFTCEGGQSMLDFECGSIVHILVCILAGFILVLFISFTALTVLVFVDRKPTSQDVVAAPHGRVGCFVFLISIGLDVLFVTVQPKDHTKGSSSITQIGLAIAIFVVNLSITFGYLYYLPFYNLNTNRIFVVSSSATLWTSICLFFCLAVNDSQDLGPSFLLLGGMPLFMFFMNSAVDMRVRALLNRPLASLTSPLLAEVKLRLELQQEQRKLTVDQARNQKLPKNVVDPAQVALVNQHIQHWRELLHQFPNSAFLHFQLANIYNTVADDDLMSGRFFRKASQLDKSLDQYFIIFQQQRLVEEHQAGGLKSMDALSYIAFEHHFQEAKRKITDAQCLQIEFWKMLIKGADRADTTERAQFRSLFEIGAKVHKATSLARYHLDRLVRVSGASPRALRLYATFVEDVLNDGYLANEFRARAEQVEDHGTDDGDELVDDEGAFNLTRNSAGKSTKLTTSMIFSNKAMMATISGEEENLGEIMAISDACCDLYGYKKSDLVGRNISTLCPHPFDTVHDQFLRRYFDTGKPHIINSTRMVFGLHQKGYIFPVNLQVTPCPANDGRVMFMGQFKPILSSNEFILMDKEGMISSLTKGLFELLALNKMVLQDRSTSITEYLTEQVLHDGFKSQELGVNLPYSPRDATEPTVFMTHRMPVTLKSDSKHEPYEISLIMLRMKAISSTCSVTTDGSLGAAAQPLGFMEGSSQSAADKRNANIVEEDPEEEEKAQHELQKKQSAQYIPTDVASSKIGRRASSRRKTSSSSRASSGPLVDSARESSGETKLPPVIQLNRVRRRASNETESDASVGNEPSVSEHTPVESFSRAEYDTSNTDNSQEDGTTGDQDTLAPLSNLSRRNRKSIDTDSVGCHSAVSNLGRRERIHQFHRIIENRNKNADPHVQHLKRIYLVMILTFSIIAVSICVISIKNLVNSSKFVGVIRDSMQRTILVQQIVADVHVYHVIHESFEPHEASIILDQYNFTLARTYEKTIQLAGVHDSITQSENSVLSYGSEAPNGVLLWLQGTGGEQGLSHLRRSNLMLGVNYLVSNARKSMEEVNSGDLSCTTSCQFIIRNGMHSISDACIRFVDRFHDGIHDELFSAEIFNYVSIVVSSVFLIVAIVNGFYPVVQRINSNKDAVARAFKLIPRGTIKGIQQQCTERLQANQASEDLDAFGEDTPQQQQQPAANKIKTNKSDRKASKVTPHGTEVKRTHSRMNLMQDTILGFVDVFITLLRLCLILFMVIGYFVAVLYWDQAVRIRTEQYTYYSYVGGHRMLEALSVANWILPPEEFTPGASFSNLSSTVEDVNYAIQSLYKLNTELIEGNLFEDEEAGRNTERQQKLLFEQGCVGAEMCAMASPELQQGLLLAFETYLQDASGLVKRYEEVYNVPNFSEKSNVTKQVIQDAVDLYLNPEMLALEQSLNLSLYYYLNDGENYVASVITTRVVAVILFVASLTLLYLFVYRTSVRHMEMELKHTRAMLLMVPGEVFEKVPEMKSFIKNMQAGKS